MRALILLLLCLPTLSFAAGRVSAGSAVEGRLQEDVNPQLGYGRVLPALFAQYRYKGLAATMEGGYEESDTSSGALKIESHSYSLGLWGRYEFNEPLSWSPFLGLGAGSFFDTVTSSFGPETDTRDGRRDFLGFNGGISTSFWRHLLVEAEMRAALIQDRKDIAYSGILRLGFVL